MITSMNNYDEDDKLMFDEDQDFEDLDDFDQDDDNELLTQRQLDSSNNFNTHQSNYLDNSFQNQTQSLQEEQKQDQPKSPRVKKVKKTEYNHVRLTGSGQNRRMVITIDVLDAHSPEMVDFNVKYLNSIPPQTLLRVLTSVTTKCAIDGVHGTDYMEITWSTTLANHKAEIKAILDDFKKNVISHLLNNNSFYESKGFQKALEEELDQ